MGFHAKNGTVSVHGTQMDYIRFGTGPRALVLLPGLGDGLRTVKGTALPMALMYRMFSRAFTVWAFSRSRDLPQDYTTRDMAREVREAMDELNIRRASVFGVSMGGMIAQHLAADDPQRVEKLVLAVTSARPNPVLTESIEEWISLAERGDHPGLMDSNLRRIYSDGYYRKNKWMIPLVGKLTKPDSYRRFFILARACLTHDAYDRLHTIQAPTLVVGGEKDLALGPEASREIAAQIPGARLRMYDAWGHGVYEEAREFNPELLAFLLESPEETRQG